MNTDLPILVVGGGVAGLSAAVHLAAAGRTVHLYDRRQHLGGRTVSWRDDVTGDTVDNGQHLLMGCYHETIRYLELIGSRHLARLQPTLHIDFADVSTGHRASLHTPSLPAPLHALVGMLRLGTLSWPDRLRLLRLGLDLLWSSKRKERRYERLSVDDWLQAMNQSETARRHLWDVIAIGSLNESADRVSALLFYRVLRAAFFGRRANASLLIPTAGLSELLIDPAARFIEAHGGRISTGTAVSEVLTEDGRVRGIRTGAQEITAAHVILAVPHHAVGPLLPADSTAHGAGQLATSPIITVNLWLDRSVMDEEIVAFLNGKMHWVFNRTSILGIPGERQYLACVVSGAGELTELEKDQLVDLAVKDLQAVFPRMRDARVTHSLVVKEMRATFVPAPGTEALRPHTQTEWQGLYLAGDWTDTGLPATIEGAVLSGRRAAESILGKQI